MRSMQSIAASVLGFAGLISSASAGTVTQTVHITATSFEQLTTFGVGALPVDPVKGEFTFTLDPTLTYQGSTDITANFLNISLGSTLEFDYDPAASPYVTIGGSAQGVGGFQFATDDFSLALNINTLQPASFAFTQAGIANGWNALTVFAEAGPFPPPPPPPGTPIPPAALMLGTALAALSALGWMRGRLHFGVSAL
jgi:hypothetical protein